MELFFTPVESTFSYFAATRRYLDNHGLPVAFYSDKDSIFKVNSKNALSGSGMTQFGRAMQNLAIELICANTPQAKGRVERATALASPGLASAGSRIETLQDRLIKELHPDNGIEFLNGHILRLWGETISGVDLSRSHPYHTRTVYFTVKMITVLQKKITPAW